MQIDIPHIIERYLAGELSLEDAADEIHQSGNFGIAAFSDSYSAADRERVEELMGRLLWLSLRKDSLDGAPETPFGSKEIRELATDTFFDESSDTPSSDSDRISLALHGSADDEIVALERRLRDAQLTGDVTALSELISDDLLFAGPDGNLATKAQDLDAHASGAIRFRAHEPEELRIRRVNDRCAITSLRARLRVEVAGSESAGVYRYTRVWVRETDGSWRVAGGHVSACSPLSESLTPEE